MIPADRSLALVTYLAKAVREGKKTQTRRLMLIPPPRGVRVEERQGWADTCPFARVGSLLWIREKASIVEVSRAVRGKRINLVRLQYEADGEAPETWIPWPERMTWVPRPGYCIPMGVHREGARTVVEVTKLRAHPIQEITEEDAFAEGIGVFWNEEALRYVLPAGTTSRYVVRTVTAREAFVAIWNSLAPPGKLFADNPWVYALDLVRTA